jgi:hypothetical protein
MKNIDNEEYEFGTSCILIYENIYVGTFYRIKELATLIQEFARDYGTENGIAYDGFRMSSLEYCKPVGFISIKSDRVKELIENIEDD